MASANQKPAVTDDRPRLAPDKRARNFRWPLALLAIVVLVWAWREAGLADIGKLWNNRVRAVDYLIGQRLDEQELQSRRAAAERSVRLQIQAEARQEIEHEFQSNGQPSPNLMALMKLAQERAGEKMAKLDPGELTRRTDELLSSEGVHGERRGGFFPPETSPKRILGDPSQYRPSSFLGKSILSAADWFGPTVANAIRWLATAVAGTGYTGGLFETVAIAVWGTLLAVALALPASLFGATRSLEVVVPGRTTAPIATRFFGKFTVRRTFDVARGFNEVVLAMILVAVLGLGPLPGVIALVIHTYGVLGKIFADVIETIDRNQIEGVLSTGASSGQVVSFAIMPQIMPYVVSQTLLRFESNVRGATILGVVGAGGIGQLLMDKFGAYELQEVCTIMILIILAVTIIDFFCSRMVRKFI